MSDEPELSYFDLQAYIGTTKHMGGFETTQTLIDLCHVGEDTRVLDVGCGVGATACYLARTYGCRVVGVDLRPSMVALSEERALREGVEERVQFRVADAQDLPFGSAQFDVVLCESVATFVEDKSQLARELARVTRPGGYIGLNEEIWLQSPPPADLVAFARRTWDIEHDLPTAEGWVAILEGAGLREVTAQTYRFDARRESTQLKRYRPRDVLRMVRRTLVLYLKSADFRTYMKDRRRLLKNMFAYWGYALFVGRKREKEA